MDDANCYNLPILRSAEYRCPCGGAADMASFYGGPAYAHGLRYVIVCRMPGCERYKAEVLDWRDTPAEAIVAWNRRCRGIEV